MEKITPAKLAYKVIEPQCGADNSLSPILFLHSLTAHKDIWLVHEPQKVADLTERKIYAIDARNHGDSEFNDVFNFDVNAVDLIHFMDTHDIQKAILIGSSMGGITAIKIALTEPERVEKIITIDIGVKRLSKWMVEMIYSFVKLWSAAVDNIPKGVNEEEALQHALDFIEKIVPPNAAISSPSNHFKKVGKYLLRRNSNGEFKVFYNSPVVLRSLKAYETLQSDPVGTFEGPALFLYGELSPFNVGQQEDVIKKHFPSAELMEFEGSGHVLHLDYPEKFFEVMMDFLLK